MKKSVNGWTFPKGMPIADVVKQVKAAGFEAFEPTLEGEGELTPTTDEATVRQLGDTIREAGLDVASFATGLYWGSNFTSPDPAVRQAAKELTIAGLDRARWLGTDAFLVVPGLVRHFERLREPVVSYADALTRAYEALRELAPEAESRGVVIAIENVWNGFLLSPVEMRELIDRVNSPWVRVYFDVGNVLVYGFPQDWIDILGARIARIHLKDFKVEIGTIEGFCPLCEGAADWAAVMSALKRAGYDGPLTYEGPGDPADVSQRIDRILATG
jgi:hexulose-6-phosphate isomerase